MSLPIERLRGVLSCDAESGILRWIVSLNPAAPIGAVAGWMEKDGYRRVSIDGVTYKAATLVWAHIKGVWPIGLVDHRNGVRHEDGIGNLRDVTLSINNQNLQRAQKNNGCGYLGVCYDKNRDKYAASITVARKHIHVGRFDDPVTAHAAYLAAKRLYHEGCTI